ncbi:putative efflux transporter [Fictibacillus macauensis ZFHKF-1]|uniref:Putative efflux transporter n=1 Tax=Fictibacillus macauensis ZFHKF-1 TaxID=1196324 RepID=I8UF69_9BACL|nr:MFS transporter [Fictibacillus macauensis]EIT85525.1 putative efflux transporter [Fictibacillus macauensis ZFHKF-1]
MPKSLWILVIAMALNVTGTSFLWPINTIYIHEYLGKSMTVAGIVLLFNSGAGVLGNLVGGSLFDKFGGYKTIVAGASINLACLLLLVLYHDFTIYSVLLAIIGFGSGVTFPAMYALAGTLWKEGGRKAFNSIYVAQNVGVALGAAGGGFAASYSFQWSFIGNAILSGVFLLLAIFGFRSFAMKNDSVSAQRATEVSKKMKKNTVFIALLILCGGYLLAWMSYVQWQSTIAVYTQEAGVSKRLYSLLWTVNGALIVLLQPVLAFIVKKWITSVKKQILTGYVIFMISFWLAGYVHEFPGFLAAMIILTLGEMFVWPAVPSIANDLAPKGKTGFYQGVVNSTATAGRMIGPLFGGMIADIWGMNIVFIVLIGLFVISIVLTLLYDRVLPTKANYMKKTG